jgi:tetratricopeptide (TPR) repeat protein
MTPGTPWYMAPEQASGEQRAAATIDVYGLAATLYHLSTFNPPFTGDATAVLAKLMREEPRPAHLVRPDLPPDLCAIIERGLAHAPDHRYPSAAALAADLRAFLDHRPVSARPLSRFARWARRVRRAPARSLAVAGLALSAALAAVALPLWRLHRAQVLGAEAAAHRARLPSLLALEGEPGQRLLFDLAEEDGTLRVLDRILAIDADDLASRVVRAALWLDKGDHAAATADMQAVAAQRASPYLQAVAQRYLAADRGQRGVLAVDLRGLAVEPATVHDHFVAGFHALRNRHEDGFARRADEHLAQALSYIPARDLRLIALVARGELEGKRELFQQAHDESVALEAIYGRPTARVLAIRGVALIVEGRYDEAIAALLEADRLRPHRHQPLTNLGIAYRRIGDLERAAEYLDKAARVRPEFWNTRHTLAQVQRDRGDHAAAFALAESLPEDGDRGAGWKRLELMASIRFAEGMACREADPAAARVRWDEASELYARALERADQPRDRESLAVKREVADAARQADHLRALKQLLRLAAGTDDPYELANLASLTPAEGLDAEAASLLAAHLRRQAIRAAKANARFAEQQRALLRAGGNR